MDLSLLFPQKEKYKTSINPHPPHTHTHITKTGEETAENNRSQNLEHEWMNYNWPIKIQGGGRQGEQKQTKTYCRML